jgi:hypothetical protein
MSQPPDPPPTPQPVRILPLILVILAVLLAWLGQSEFSSHLDPTLTGWGSYILAVVCLVAAERLLPRA